MITRKPAQQTSDQTSDQHGHVISSVVEELAGRVNVDNRDIAAAAIRQRIPLISETELSAAVDRVIIRLFGLGDIEELFADSTVSEIMINGPGRIWVERNGRVEYSDLTVTAQQLDLLIERIIAPLGRRVDRCNPQVDARLPDGSRVHIATAPIALDGPYVTIRRFAMSNVVIEDFTTSDIADLIEVHVRKRSNIIVSGATSTGKTTLLNALSAAIGGSERIVTIEDSAELNLRAEHVLRLECQKQPSSSGDVIAIAADLGELVKASLRMRPDRIIVGEVRGREAFHMVQALLTGHAGSMSSVHASCPEQALDRIETLMMLADSGISPDVAKRQIQRAFDLVIHLERSNSKRHISSVLQIGVNGERKYLVFDNELLVDEVTDSFGLGILAEAA